MFPLVLLAVFSQTTDNSPMFLIEENKHSFLVAPASDAIRLSSPVTSKALQQLRPVKIVANEAAEMMKPLSATKSECGIHSDEKGCIVDMHCGWCMGSGGGVCVSGDFAGPVDRNLPCPVYVTYQIPIKQDDTTAEDLFPASFNSTTTSSTSNSFADDTSPIIPTQPAIDIDNEDSDPEQDVSIHTKPTPDVRDSWYRVPAPPQKGIKVPQPPSTPRNPQSPHVPILTLPEAVSGYDASTSPCGLPGVPPFVCQAWIKTHCGPNDLTDSVIRNLPAANNGYDWCATVFENNPEIFGPEHKPFPWYINGQLVQ
eukprot:c6822_g1_i1.p1 GENE.c6822_g1_i1~~c6822_g1_i1.p1  ORF type:complete len:312 (-),score=76.57 c6822_g1_i1:34-969(-)